tara:strand:- start:1500 stop:1718 length:219 start_codon:yes stop_codon:yes gene_type:complete
MPDEIVRKAKAGNAIFNGSIIVSIGERAHLDESGAPASGHRIHPDVNQFVASGTHFSRLNTRFDEHYGGGPS